MVIPRPKNGRRIAGDLVQPARVEEPVVCEGGVVTRADDPGIVGAILLPLADDGEDAREILRLSNSRAGVLEPAEHRVGVALADPRNHGPAVEVDDCRVGEGGQILRLLAQRDDAVPFDRNRVFRRDGTVSLGLDDHRSTGEDCDGHRRSPSPGSPSCL